MEGTNINDITNVFIGPGKSESSGNKNIDNMVTKGYINNHIRIANFHFLGGIGCDIINDFFFAKVIIKTIIARNYTILFTNSFLEKCPAPPATPTPYAWMQSMVLFNFLGNQACCFAYIEHSI